MKFMDFIKVYKELYALNKKYLKSTAEQERNVVIKRIRELRIMADKIPSEHQRVGLFLIWLDENSPYSKQMFLEKIFHKLDVYNIKIPLKIKYPLDGPQAIKDQIFNEIIKKYGGK